VHRAAWGAALRRLPARSRARGRVAVSFDPRTAGRVAGTRAGCRAAAPVGAGQAAAADQAGGAEAPGAAGTGAYRRAHRRTRGRTGRRRVAHRRTPETTRTGASSATGGKAWEPSGRRNGDGGTRRDSGAGGRSWLAGKVSAAAQAGR